MLTRDQLVELLDYDPETGQFTNRITRNPRALVGQRAGDPTGTGYWRVQINKSRYQAHRLVWLWAYGQFPDRQIDHINGDRSDNRLANLRLATNKENHENVKLRADSATGVRGVHLHTRGNRYIAQVCHNGVGKHIGSFRSLEDAQAAVRKARDSVFTHHKTEYAA